VGLAETWWKIERSLPEDWKEAHLRLRLDDDTYAERAAALLGPANPVRSGDAITLYTARHGSGVAPKAVARLLTLLDEEGVRAELELASLAHGETPSADEERWLVDSWDELVAGLPEDWSDLYAEIDLDSSDYLDPGALALAPLNPARFSEVTGFRFRCARRVGYGASPEMVRRCLERLDERGITGEVLALRSLSDTKTVSTQGPVWYVGGRSV
jgi:hypothetical protein